MAEDQAPEYDGEAPEEEKEPEPKVSRQGSGRDRKYVITLAYPVEHGEDEYKVLELRKPKGKDFRGIPDSPKTGDIMDLAARLASVPGSVLDELDPVDFVTVMGTVENFMPKSQQTPKT